MSNLTTWSKKYSTEVKHNIDVALAHQQRAYLMCFFWAAATAILAFAYLSTPRLNGYLMILLPLIWGFVLFTYFFISKPYHGHLVLTEGGLLELDNDITYQLNPASFYCVFGCMLIANQRGTDKAGSNKGAHTCYSNDKRRNGLKRLLPINKAHIFYQTNQSKPTPKTSL